MTASTPTTWIVGHDGSAGAARAVEWALAQAQGRAVDIMLLRAWQLPAIDVPIPAQAIDDFAPLQVCGNLDEVTAAADQFGVALTTKIEQGGPSQTLLHASEDAALLVVGGAVDPVRTVAMLEQRLRSARVHLDLVDQQL